MSVQQTSRAGVLSEKQGTRLQPTIEIFTTLAQGGDGIALISCLLNRLWGGREIICYYYYYYLLELSFHAVAVVLTLVTNKNKYT